jgi:hypothetical protein
MKDVNYPLRTAYITALASLTDIDGAPVGVWYKEIPEADQSRVFVLISPVSATDSSTKSSHDLTTAMQVQVHEWDDLTTSGRNIDYVAGKVMEAIYADPQSNIAIGSGLRIVNTRIDSDVPSDYGTIGGRRYLSRTLTFSHLITT